MSLDVLKKKIKEKDTCGLIYLYGAEEYLKSHYYEQLRNKTVSGMEEFNVIELSGDALDLNTLENLVNSFPMMSDKKFIGVIDFGQFFKSLIGNAYHTHVWFYGAKRVVCRLRARVGYCVKKG